MDLALIKLSIGSLLEKVEHLEEENQEFKARIDKLEEKSISSPVTDEIKEKKEDVLIDTKDVLSILGISYNTLRAMVRRNLLYPIRINQRRVRYSKRAIYDFIASRSH